MTMKGGKAEHVRTTITTSTIPQKTSSDLLRSLALQDRPGVLNEADGHSSSHTSWWSVGVTPSVGRAAQAVMAMSPPSKGAATFEEVARQFTGVGLGLAKGGEGVRKVKSNWELNRQVSDAPSIWTQIRLDSGDGRANAMNRVSEPTETPSDGGVPSLPRSTMSIDEDEFGYNPLPAGYETQCVDDSIMFGSEDVFGVGSLGSSASRTSSEEGVDDMMMMLGNTSISSDADAPGRRILLNAVEYDESLDLPSSSESFSIHSPFPMTSPSGEQSTVTPTQGSEEDVFRSRPQGQSSKPAKSRMDLTAEERENRLKKARSTPALKSRPSQSWFDFVKGFVVPPDAPAVPTLPPPKVSRTRGPGKITAPKVAAPMISRAIPVVCDSSSLEAEDLPALPAMENAASTDKEASGSNTLRNRPSLAMLRNAIGFGDPDPMPQLDVAPTLSPRFEWSDDKALNESYFEKHDDPSEELMADEEPVVKLSNVGPHGSIDYTNSFFYKPPTPPHQQTGVQSKKMKKSDPVAKRQRSIKSLRANLTIPLVLPPLPTPISNNSIPSIVVNSGSVEAKTPPRRPPIIAIQSPGTYEAGLPPRELVLEGEEWEAKEAASRSKRLGRRSKDKLKPRKARHM